MRRVDDEMAMNTQAQGNLTGGPVYSGGGGDGSSYGSQQPMAETGQRPNGGLASRNF